MKTGGNKGTFFHQTWNTCLFCKGYQYLQNHSGKSNQKELIEKVYNQIETEGIMKGEKDIEVMGLYQAGLDVRPNQRYWIKMS